MLDNNSTEPNTLKFASKCLHLCSLNIKHILPNINENRILFSHDKRVDILSICESFLSDHYLGNLIRTDRSETTVKCGGGLILHFRQLLNIKHQKDIENANIETIWAEVSLPNSKPFWFQIQNHSCYAVFIDPRMLVLNGWIYSKESYLLLRQLA